MWILILENIELPKSISENSREMRIFAVASENDNKRKNKNPKKRTTKSKRIKKI